MARPHRLPLPLTAGQLGRLAIQKAVRSRIFAVSSTFDAISAFFILASVSGNAMF